MSSETQHVKELKSFIFSQLRDKGFASTDKELDHLLFQTSRSLRLRKEGYLVLKGIYDHEDFPLDKALTGRELMTLKRHIGWPYFLPLNHSHLVLFITTKDAFFLKLQGGDVKKWLEQIRQKKSG